MNPTILDKLITQMFEDEPCYRLLSRKWWILLFGFSDVRWKTNSSLACEHYIRVRTLRIDFNVKKRKRTDRRMIIAINTIQDSQGYIVISSKTMRRTSNWCSLAGELSKEHQLLV